MASRNPLKDQLAIVGVGVAAYSRENSGRSRGRMTLEASVNAIKDAGLKRDDIDGISASVVTAQYVQPGLGIPEVRWWSNTSLPYSNQLEAAIYAVYAGACDVALVCHSELVGPRHSKRAAADPYRVREQLGVGDHRAILGTDHIDPLSLNMGSPGYAAWSGRYMHDFGAKKEQFGYIALNARRNARENPNAVMQKPLTMAEYLAGRVIRDPLCIFDHDLPVDGADAVIVTTAERAADMVEHPVLIHAVGSGQYEHANEERTLDFDHTSQVVAGRELWAKSDLTVADVDVFCLYDGFTIITLNWLENIGLCGRGEAGPFVEEAWDAGEGRLRIGEKGLLNPHGGNLTEGHTDGSGHIREAVFQLRGEADGRQVSGAKAALVTIGGLFTTKVATFLLRGE